MRPIGKHANKTRQVVPKNPDRWVKVSDRYRPSAAPATTRIGTDLNNFTAC